MGSAPSVAWKRATARRAGQARRQGGTAAALHRRSEHVPELCTTARHLLTRNCCGEQSLLTRLAEARHTSPDSRHHPADQDRDSACRLERLLWQAVTGPHPLTQAQRLGAIGSIYLI